MTWGGPVRSAVHAIGAAVAAYGVFAVDKDKRIARGKWRDVYLHPSDETKVIKVHRPDQSPAARRARHWYGRVLPVSRYDANARDLRHYGRLAERAPAVLERVSAVYGYAETSEGRALVAEHVRDADGRTSESLRSFVMRNGLAEITPLVEEFFETMAAHHVPVEDPTWHNILVQRTTGRLWLVLVDGLGDPTVIPYKTVFKGLNRDKLMRKKGRLLAKLRRIAAPNAGSTGLRIGWVAIGSLPLYEILFCEFCEVLF